MEKQGRARGQNNSGRQKNPISTVTSSPISKQISWKMRHTIKRTPLYMIGIGTAQNMYNRKKLRHQ